MSSTQHQLIEQCATRLRGIVEALDNIHDSTPHRWSTDLDEVHSSAESLLAMINDQASNQAALAQPSPAQAEKAEVEWPEVVGQLVTWPTGQRYVGRVRERKGCKTEDVMTVAQHERIVGALRARNEKLEADAGALEWLRSTFKVHKAIVEQAGCETIEQLAEQRDAANERADTLEHRMMGMMTRHFAEAWRNRDTQKALDGYLSAGIAQLEQERDAALANVDALAVQVLKLGGTISFAHHRTDQAGQVPQAWLDVQAERRRQVEAEGWTPEHDDAHSHGEMARAAACYALAGSSAPNDGTAALLVSLAWPWDEQWWKPTTTRRDLVKACALGLAEIERLDRAAASQGGPSDA